MIPGNLLSELRYQVRCEYDRKPNEKHGNDAAG